MRTALIFIPLVLVGSQDPAVPTLDEVIEGMEKAAAPARGSTFVLSTAAGVRFEFTLPSVDVAVARDGSMRIREPNGARRDEPTLYRRTREMVLTRDAVHDIVEEIKAHPTMGLRHPLVRITQRFPRTEVQGVDPFTERWGLASYQNWFWHAYFFAISPRLAFGFERNLKMLGRRMLDGTPCFVLRSARPLDYASEFNDGAGDRKRRGPTGQVRKFYVRASDFRLVRFEDTFIGDGGVLASRFSLFEKYEEGLPVLATIAHGHLVSGWRVQPTTAVEIKRGLDIPGDSLRPDPKELSASMARHAVVPDRLDNAFGHADVLWSSIVAKSNRSFGGGGLDEQRLAADLEELVAVSPTATPVRNLLVQLAFTGDETGMRRLLTRISKNPALAAATASERIQAHIKLGELDKALEILDANPELDKGPTFSRRFEILLRKGDYAGAAKAVVRWPGGNPGLSLYSLLFPLRREVKTYSEPALAAAFAEEMKCAPHDNLRRARLMMLSQSKDPVLVAEASKEAFQNSRSDDVLDLAAGNLRTLHLNPPPHLLEKRAAIREALDAGGTRRGVGIARALLFLAEGNPLPARKELVRELDAAEAAPPDLSPATSALTQALVQLGDDELLARACRLLLRPYHASQVSPEGLAWMGKGDPMKLLLEMGERTGSFTEFYRAFKGLFLLNGLGGPMGPPHTFEMRPFLDSMKKEAFGGKDPAGARWLGKLIMRTLRSNRPEGMSRDDAIECFNAALQIDPRDLESLQNLAEIFGEVGDCFKAADAASSIAAALDAGRTCEGPWSKIECRVFEAFQRMKSEDLDGARERIKGVDLDGTVQPGWLLWQAAQVLEQLGEYDRAMQAYERSEEDGHRASYPLALLNIRKKDWDAALRHVNRMLADGYVTAWLLKPGRAMGTEHIQKLAQDRTEIPRRLKGEILEKAGPDYFIKRLLASKLPDLSADESARAEKALAALESGTDDEKRAAIKEFQALGSGSAAILSRSPSRESKELLLEWALRSDY